MSSPAGGGGVGLPFGTEARCSLNLCPFPPRGVRKQPMPVLKEESFPSQTGFLGHWKLNQWAGGGAGEVLISGASPSPPASFSLLRFPVFNFPSPPRRVSLPPLGADGARLVNYCHFRLVRSNSAHAHTESPLTHSPERNCCPQKRVIWIDCLRDEPEADSPTNPRRAQKLLSPCSPATCALVSSRALHFERTIIWSISRVGRAQRQLLSSQQGATSSRSVFRAAEEGNDEGRCSENVHVVSNKR